MNDRKTLCKQLSFVQLRDETKKQVRLDIHEAQFQLLFEDYDPFRIRKNGSYLSQLERVLKVFSPSSPSPYKKVTKAVFLSARYLSSFESAEAFLKEVKKNTADDKSRYLYLDSFRVKSHLSSMYFNRTCKFFKDCSILDVPVLDKEYKEKAMKVLHLKDDKEEIFLSLLSLRKKEKKSSDEIKKEILNS